MPHITLNGKVADEKLRQWTAKRGQWTALEESGEALLALLDNRTTDWRHGTVAIAGNPAWRDYEYSLEFCLLAPPEGGTPMAWPGAVFRAQDTENYELLWFMPVTARAESGGNVVYLSVAHGLVPWWTDAYVAIPRGNAPYTYGEWLPISIRIRGLEASVHVRGQPDPILTVRLTYYINGGCVGVYCGTQTSAKFRRMKVEPLPQTALPNPPTVAARR
jgi:hypothetical protein